MCTQGPYVRKRDFSIGSISGKLSLAFTSPVKSFFFGAL